jgi:hypothetical protein
MNKYVKTVKSLLMSLMLLVCMTGNAMAALKQQGPVDPVTTIPTYYQDTSGLALQPCLDQNGFCILPPPFDAGTPITTLGPINPSNFPDESFYFIADSIITVPGGPTLVYRAALEAAFLSGSAPNTGITFLRINLKKASGLSPNSTYTVTHPYGTFSVNTNGIGELIVTNAGQAYRAEDPSTPTIGVYFPPEMQGATTTHVGPFLTRAAGLITNAGKQYIGDSVTPVTVTGSPFGTNFFRVDGPNVGGTGVNTVQTNLFTLAGRVFTGTVAAPMTIDRATYARDAVSGQVDIFASSSSSALLSVSGTGLATTPMSHDTPGTGKFYAHLPFTTSVPADLAITNSLDTPTPVPHPVTLVDEVNITQATYDPVTSNLTIKAASRDTVSSPVLTVPAFAAPNTLVNGTLVVHLPATMSSTPPDAGLIQTIPLETVTVHSSRGGSATAPVSIFSSVVAPVAVNDSATTNAGAPVTITVLANDSAAGTINPATVAISAQSVNGFAVASLDGTVTFTPAAGFSGAATTFAYTVKDGFGQVSNPATVTVTVNAPPPSPVVAVADTASTTVNSAVVISVLANDSTSSGSIDPATVQIVTQSINGNAVANVNGTVTFTPTGNFVGTTTFAYTVKNTPLTATSNAAIVTVTVTGTPAGNIAPFAANDVASAIVNQARIINVVANDTDADGTVNPSTVLIITSPLTGTAVNNLDGTVTYTPSAAGTDSFTYTVKDNLGLVSNPGTVTISSASAVADSVNVLKAQYTASKGDWLVSGTTTNVSPLSKNVTVYIGSTLTGQVLGTAATNPLDGRWKLQLTGVGNPPPNPPTISVALPSGSSRLAFPVAVK